MKTYEELNDLVVQWGKDKGIVKTSRAQVVAQLSKVKEELAEFEEAILGFFDSPTPENFEAASLELGDLQVTILISAACSGLNPTTCLSRAYRKIKDRTGKVINGQFVKDPGQ